MAVEIRKEPLQMKKRFFLKFINCWCCLFIKPILFIGGKSKKKISFLEKILSVISRDVEQNKEVFCSFNLRRIHHIETTHGYVKFKSNEKIAVIIQGPILIENDFTIETIKMYKEYGSNIDIILSTWKDEDDKIIEKIRKLDVYVVLSEKPAFSGVKNINYQLVSFQAGINKARELGSSYICKTRTDQRLYSKASFLMMKNLIKSFPSDNASLSGRIVVLPTVVGSLYKAYYISDFLYMGKTEDMLNFLLIPLDTREIVRDPTVLFEAIENKLIPEFYLIRNLISMIKGESQYDISVKGYWKFIKECLVLIDRTMIGLYWAKYDIRYCEHIGNGSLLRDRNADNLENFDFALWLCLINDELEYYTDIEEFMKKGI